MTTYPSIFNDVIGPVMRGPSSSHCAASLRIGRICRDLTGGEITDARVEYDPHGSLATTHAGLSADEVVERMRAIVRIMARAIDFGLQGTAYADRILGAQSLGYQQQLREGSLLGGAAEPGRAADVGQAHRGRAGPGRGGTDPLGVQGVLTPALYTR